MKAIFLADAHLKGLDDPNQKLLCSFLENLKDIDKIFILGDLFEFWAGFNEILEHHYSPVLSQFKRLKAANTEIIYIEGNHDFSVGPFFKDILGCQIYSDSADVTLDGKRFFLSHGDIVEPNISHKIWRSFLRSTLSKLIVKIVPPSLAWKIAMILSEKSRYRKRGSVIHELQKEFAKKKINQDFDIVILAHSHTPEIIELFENCKKGIYANPGDWLTEFSYLSFENGNIKLERYCPFTR